MKQVGKCCDCSEECYEVLETYPSDDPFVPNEPRRLGAALECHTQVEFLLSDGSEADVSFCVTCAEKLRPADYPRVWDACCVRGDVDNQRAGRSLNARKVAWARLQHVWPLGVLRWRRHAPASGLMVVDRRWRA